MAIIDKLPYKCGNLPNHTATFGNNIYWTFQKYVHTTKTPLNPILSNQKLNVNMAISEMVTILVCTIKYMTMIENLLINLVR